jgi:hypothetical protein
MSVEKGKVADLGFLVEFVGGNVVDGEDELDVVLLCLFNEILDLLGSLRVEERSTDLRSANTTFSRRSSLPRHCPRSS